MSAQGQPGDPFTYVPRDVRNLIWEWLGPSPLWTVRARSVCRAWMEWVPCTMDVMRSLETGELTVLPVRWSLIETVVRLILHEPDEVCSRMDETLQRFLYLDPYKKDGALLKQSLTFNLLRPAFRLGKFSIMESFLCHAHLEKSTRGCLWDNDILTVMIGTMFSYAISYDRSDYLRQWRVLFWGQPLNFRIAVYWRAFVTGSNELFDTVARELKCDTLELMDDETLCRMGVLSARDCDYLDMPDNQKRVFIARVLQLPEKSRFGSRLTNLGWSSQDEHNAAMVTDVAFAVHKETYSWHAERCKELNLCYDLSAATPFVRRAPVVHDNNSGSEEEEEEAGDNNGQWRAGSPSNNNSSDESSDEGKKRVDASQWICFSPVWPDLNFKATELKLLEDAKKRTVASADNVAKAILRRHGKALGAAAALEAEKARLRTEKMIKENLEWANRQKLLPSARHDLMVQQTRKRSVVVELRHFWASRPGQKRTRADLFRALSRSHAEDDDFVVPDIDEEEEEEPYHSSEEARIRAEEDELEFMDDDEEEEEEEEEELEEEEDEEPKEEEQAVEPEPAKEYRPVSPVWTVSRMISRSQQIEKEVADMAETMRLQQEVARRRLPHGWGKE